MPSPSSALYPSDVTYPGFLGSGPDDVRVEVEFTPGVWTDVTAWVEFDNQIRMRFGRSSPWQAPQPSTLTGVVLNNADGRFSPERATLVDGTPHPYWPNVKPQRRIRVRMIDTTVSFTRFVGYVKGWPQAMEDGWYPRVELEAYGVDARLGSVELSTPLVAEITYSDPVMYWPLTDEDDATSAAEVITDASSAALKVAGASTGPLAFHAFDGPGVDDGSVPLTPANVSQRLENLRLRDGPYIRQTSGTPIGRSPTTVGATIELWVRGSRTATSEVMASVVLGDDEFTYVMDIGPTSTWGVTYPDLRTKRWRHVVIWLVWGDDNLVTAWFNVDGVQVGSANKAIDGDVLRGLQIRGIRLFAGLAPTVKYFSGAIGHVALYDRLLTRDEMESHEWAGRGWSGETTSQRAARLLRYAGLTSDEWDIDASDVACGTYPQGGKSVLAALQDTAETESGGSVFWVTQDGMARFTSRDQRAPGPPKVIVDAADDVDGNAFDPEYGEDTIVNEVKGTRATATYQANAVTVRSQGSIDEYGLFSDSFTSYAKSAADVKQAAHYRLAAQSSPGYRFGRLSVDLFTGLTAGLTSAIANLEIGHRIQVKRLYDAAAPSQIVEVIVEGWEESLTSETYRLVFDTSPADLPAVAVFDDDIQAGDKHSKFGSDTLALQSSITSTATTVVIDCSYGSLHGVDEPVFSTDSLDYPLFIQVDNEVIKLNTVPSGSTSPQTFTGVTRGQAGVRAAAHAVGAKVLLWPDVTYGL